MTNTCNKRMRTWSVALILGVAGIIFAASPAGARVAGLENKGLQEFDQISTSNGTAEVSRGPAFRGSASAQFNYSGGGANGYARGVFEPDWRPGDRVLYKAAFKLQRGFYRAMQGQVALMRWDNWPEHGGSGDAGGIVIYGGDRKARLTRSRYGGEQVALGRAFRIPEGRWVKLSVRQRLSAGRAHSVVRMNGRKVASSNQANSYGRPISRVRYGIVAIDAGAQHNPLRVWVDDAIARKSR